jgi:hypothetical protein
LVDVDVVDILVDMQVVDIFDEEIVEKIFFDVVDEATLVLDEDVIVRSADLNIFLVLGMDFPAYRYWLEKVKFCFLFILYCF